jgi:hypothetical protein
VGRNPLVWGRRRKPSKNLEKCRINYRSRHARSQRASRIRARAWLSTCATVAKRGPQEPEHGQERIECWRTRGAVPARKHGNEHHEDREKDSDIERRAQSCLKRLDQPETSSRRLFGPPPASVFINARRSPPVGSAVPPVPMSPAVEPMAPMPAPPQPPATRSIGGAASTEPLLPDLLGKGGAHLGLHKERGGHCRCRRLTEGKVVPKNGRSKLIAKMRRQRNSLIGQSGGLLVIIRARTCLAQWFALPRELGLRIHHR